MLRIYVIALWTFITVSCSSGLQTTEVQNDEATSTSEDSIKMDAGDNENFTSFFADNKDELALILENYNHEEAFWVKAAEAMGSDTKLSMSSNSKASASLPTTAKFSPSPTPSASPSPGTVCPNSASENSKLLLAEIKCVNNKNQSACIQVETLKKEINDEIDRIKIVKAERDAIIKGPGSPQAKAILIAAKTARIQSIKAYILTLIGQLMQQAVICDGQKKVLQLQDTIKNILDTINNIF